MRNLAAAASVIVGAEVVELSPTIDELNVKVFADGADLDGILALAADTRIAGFTTNPTLMWKAGLTDYEEFAKRLLERITTHPISFEVFADDAGRCAARHEMIAQWGETSTSRSRFRRRPGEPMAPLVRELSEDGVKVNVTAVFTTAQVELLTGGRQGRRCVIHLGLRRPDRRRRHRSGPADGSRRRRSWSRRRARS